MRWALGSTLGEAASHTEEEGQIQRPIDPHHIGVAEVHALFEPRQQDRVAIGLDFDAYHLPVIA